MKKRIISLAIAVMFGCSIYTSAITTYAEEACGETDTCLLYTSPSPRDTR